MVTTHVFKLGITNRPFEKMIDAFSKNLAFVVVTKTIKNISGDEVLSDASSVTIQGPFFRKESDWSQDNEGLFQGADAVLLVKSGVDINKDDKVTYDSETYRVEKVVPRRLGKIFFYRVARLFLNS